MRKIIKMCRFEATDLMNKLLVLPTVGSEKDEDIDVIPLKEFIEQNKKDLTTLGKYLVEEASAKKLLKPPKNFETMTDNLVTQLHEIIKKYYPDLLEEPSDYRGMTAYYKSDGPAKFFLITKTSKDKPDNNDYFGHCMAFGKCLTKLICAALEFGLIIGKAVIDILLKIHKIPEDIREFMDRILIWIFDKIKYELEKYKKHDFGMIWFYFDRVDKLSHIYDKFVPLLQPVEPWLPSYFYPQAEWIKVWP